MTEKEAGMTPVKQDFTGQAEGGIGLF